MVRNIVLLSALAALASLLALAPARRVAAEDDPGLERAVAASQHIARALRLSPGVPGYAVGISVAGKTLWIGGFGFADVGIERKATTDTRFRLGSVSKVVTAAALARLVEQGVLNLDAPIREYVPNFPDESDGITARRLAGHLAGVRHYLAKDFGSDGSIDDRHFETTSDALTIFSADTLVALPGEAYHYSTFGYTLLSAAIESAAGTDFLTVIEREVTGPLSMDATGADRADSSYEERSEAYVFSGVGIELANRIDPSYKWAGGGLVSTARDMLRFGNAHLGGDYLQPATRELLFTAQRTADGEETGVGIGWRIGEDDAGRTIYHHAGNIVGGRSFIALFPEQEVVVVVLTNIGMGPAFVESTAMTILDPIFDHLDDRWLASKPPSGTYRLELESEGKSEPGFLRLTYPSSDADGYLSTPAAYRRIIQRFGVPAEDSLRVVRARMDEETGRIRCVIASLLGNFELDGRIEGSEIAGTIGAFRVQRLTTTFRGTSPQR